MAMWAGVQNVSRPIDMCQEMSQCPPIIAEVTAATVDQTYQGTRAAGASVSSLTLGTRAVARGTLDMTVGSPTCRLLYTGDGLVFRERALDIQRCQEILLWVEKRRNGSGRPGFRRPLRPGVCSRR